MGENRFVRFSNLVNRSSKSIQKLKRMNMERYGLSGAHTNCLYRLLQAQDTGLNQRELMELEQMDKAQVSRVLKELEAKEYVTTDETHGYKASYYLTPAGKRVAEEIAQIVNRYLNKIGEGMTEAQRRTFYEAFEMVATDLENAIRDLSV